MSLSLCKIKVRESWNHLLSSTSRHSIWLETGELPATPAAFAFSLKQGPVPPMRRGLESVSFLDQPLESGGPTFPFFTKTAFPG